MHELSKSNFNYHTRDVKYLLGRTNFLQLEAPIPLNITVRLNVRFHISSTLVIKGVITSVELVFGDLIQSSSMLFSILQMKHPFFVQNNWSHSQDFFP